MHGGGHIAEMNRRSSALRVDRKSRSYKDYLKSRMLKPEKGALEERSATAEQMIAIRQKIKQLKRESRLKFFVSASICLILIVFALWNFKDELNAFNPYTKVEFVETLLIDYEIQYNFQELQDKQPVWDTSRTFHVLIHPTNFK